jgi:glycosyltransferase involved in cell wall biosynthesis
MKKWNIIIYIPVYNAESTIKELIERIHETVRGTNASLKSLILVDDGSTDNTRGIIRDLADKYHFIEYVQKKRNEGPAAAIFDGMHLAIKHIEHTDQTIIIRMDSDLEHQPEDIPNLIKPIMENKTKISVGYTPFDMRSGLFSSITEFGSEESREFLGMDIPQFCPGFNATKGDLFLELVPKLNELSVKFKKRYGRDMLTIDFIHLFVASFTGEKISVLKLSPIEKRHIKIIPKEKADGYKEYHEQTMKFLREFLSQ